MPKHWLKPFGTASPPSPLPDDWTDRLAEDPFPLMTGPRRLENPPRMQRGDRVLFHAVMHSRVFAEGEILDDPAWTPDGRWGERWPWTYPCGVLLWIPRISDAPRTTAVAPKRAVGHIQRGAQYALLDPGDYRAIRAALLACPTAMRRSDET